MAANGSAQPCPVVTGAATTPPGWGLAAEQLSWAGALPGGPMLQLDSLLALGTNAERDDSGNQTWEECAEIVVTLRTIEMFRLEKIFKIFN